MPIPSIPRIKPCNNPEPCAEHPRVLEADDLLIPDELQSVLIEAHEIVSNRNDAYGEPTDTAERVATSFTTLTKREIKPADVALIQMLFKIVRSEHGYKRDNNVDLAGYTDIRERCFLKELEE